MIVANQGNDSVDCYDSVPLGGDTKQRRVRWYGSLLLGGLLRGIGASMRVNCDGSMLLRWHTKQREWIVMVPSR